MCLKLKKNPGIHLWIVLGTITGICILFFKIALNIHTTILALGSIPDFYNKLQEYSKDFLLSQVSMTFISISVMSVLSENNLIIYWENVVKKRLISPIFLCFSSLTIYAFVIMFFSLLSFGLGIPSGTFIFFLLAIADLIVLTSIMIGLYYGREKRKSELEKEFVGMNRSQKKECLDKLQAYTILAYENKEYEKLMENCYFYGKYARIIDLRFLFDQFLLGDGITAYDCRIFEKIYMGALDGFEERYKRKWKENDKETGLADIIKPIYEEINPLESQIFKSYLDKSTEEGDTYGKIEIKELTGKYLGELIKKYIKEKTKESLDKKTKLEKKDLVKEYIVTYVKIYNDEYSKKRDWLKVVEGSKLAEKVDINARSIYVEELRNTLNKNFINGILSYILLNDMKDILKDLSKEKLIELKEDEDKFLVKCPEAKEETTEEIKSTTEEETTEEIKSTTEKRKETEEETLSKETHLYIGECDEAIEWAIEKAQRIYGFYEFASKEAHDTIESIKNIEKSVPNEMFVDNALKNEEFTKKVLEETPAGHKFVSEKNGNNSESDEGIKNGKEEKKYD